MLLVLPSCKKYLAATPSKSLVVIRTVADLQGLMDNSSYMNTLCSEAGEIAADNYFLTNTNYAALKTQAARDAYIWNPGIFNGISPSDWQNQYTVVYNANVVLDNIGAIPMTGANAADWDNCKGQALVFRGKTFLETAAIWAKGYDSASAVSTPGIPLRLTSDFNTPTTRASLADTYRQIIADLKAAIPLLPNLPLFVFRPSKASAFGYLSRAYLAMRDYPDAGLYADSCLQINGSLIDFNTLNTTLTYPFSPFQYTNPEEVIYTTCALTNQDIYNVYARIDTVLYQSYAPNDLRKSIYFKLNTDGYQSFRGSYYGLFVSFNGVATDEMVLTRAECSARNGNIAAAMADLNALLVKRWKTGTFVPLSASTADAARQLILVERRKELFNRMTRFVDIKRLNLEGANINIVRMLNGQIYTLPANDNRFALPIPDNVIQASGIQQN